MSTLTIPKPVRPGLVKLSELSDNATEDLVSQLSRVSHATELPQFLGPQNFRIPEVSEKESQRIFLSINSVASFWSNELDIPLSDFVSDLADTLASEDEGQHKLESNKIDVFKNRLTKILELEAVQAIAKAFGLQTAYERVFDDVRILTDIRPVFRSRDLGDPIAMVRVHTLKIDYLHGSDSESFYIALTDDDIEDLRKALDRCDKKCKALDAFVGRMKVPHLGGRKKGG